MELLVIGVVVAANFIFIMFKYEQGRLLDASLDAILLTLVTIVFMGSYAGLVVGTVASLLISIYLYYKPPKIKLDTKQAYDLTEFFEEFKRRARPKHD